MISTVRSFNAKRKIHPLGFLLDPRRFNVAVTRARIALMIFGNPSVLSLSTDWNEIIWYCRQNGAYEENHFDGIDYYNVDDNDD